MHGETHAACHSTTMMLPALTSLFTIAVECFLPEASREQIPAELMNLVNLLDEHISHKMEFGSLYVLLLFWSRLGDDSSATMGHFLAGAKRRSPLSPQHMPRHTWPHVHVLPFEHHDAANHHPHCSQRQASCLGPGNFSQLWKVVFSPQIGLRSRVG